MANLKYGSTGDDVKKLQEALGFTGNDVDGIFGQKTQQAVKNYQKANNLAVDGIAGKDTLGALYGTSPTPGTTTTVQGKTNQLASTGTNTATVSTQATDNDATETPTTTIGGFTYKDFVYDEFSSGIVDQASQLLQQHQANKPGSYTPVWQDEADAYLNQYQNRGPFSYDFNSDALYNQYKDNYIRQGQMAMMDTMGQAAAMTGGYGNSYAQGVGQQAYQQYLGQLNAVLPELYQMAHDRYTQEGQDLLAMYDLYMGKENQAYGQYQDTVDRWYQESNRLQDNYNTLYNQEYGKYLDEKQTARDEYNAGKDMAWDEYLRELEKEQTAAELLAGAGNYDRLGEVYGLSEEETEAIKKANTPKTSSGPKQQTYKDLTWEEKQQLTKIFGGATTTEQLGQLAGIYGNGYNPDDIDQIMRYANPDLYYQEPESPASPDPWEEEQARRRAARQDGNNIYQALR